MVLSIGTIVQLIDGTQKLMILNRAPLVEENGTNVWYDYSACKFPMGLDINEVFYFNEENISNVIFEGYFDDTEKRFRDFYSEWVEGEGQKLQKGVVKKVID